MTTRRHDLDWVRVCAFGVLVLYHVGMYYVSWDWHVKSPQAGPALEPLMLLSSPWRLSLLFLVSGTATAFLFARTPQGFLRSRSRRLLWPLAFGMLVVVVPQSYYEVVENLPGGYADGYFTFYGRYLAADGSFCRDGDCLALPTWNHLWFVAYLWVYTVILWLLIRFLPRLVERARTAASGLLSGVGVLLWPALLLVVARVALVGRFESTHALADDWYNHAQYLPMFLLGFLIAKATVVWQALQRLRWIALLVSATSAGFIVWYFTLSEYGDAVPPPDALRMGQRVVWGIAQWCTIAAIFGFAYRLRETDSAALRYLGPAVFPVYILHQSVIVVAAHNFKPWAMAPMLEGPLLAVLTFTACFAGYEVIRRIRWLRPLFGLKLQPARSSPAQTAALQES